jgi:sugar phosphate isomerase/epimerase
MASSRGVQPAPIRGLSLAEAITINERSHRFDGIERIEDDGTVVYCPASVEIMQTTLGYNCPRLRPADAEERATELMSRFREYANRHGVRF